MKLFEKARLQQMYKQRINNDWDRVFAREGFEQFPHDEAHSAQDHYQLRLEVGCNFYSTPGHLPEARRNAEKMIAHTFFGDTLQLLARARMAVLEHDEESAIKALNAIEDELVK